MEKNTSFTDLINFLCNIFSSASRKINNFIEELEEGENKIPSSNLIEVYFRILYKGSKAFPISTLFNKHLIKYIEKNSGKGPLSLWYRLVIEESNERLAYLYKNLKPEYAVKKEHFLDYPEKIQETISLFTYLYFGKYFTYNYIIELDYYKNSINAKNELINLTYEQGEKLYNKYKSYYKLFKLFIPIKQFNEKNYNSEFTSFYKKLKSYKSIYDSLMDIYNYWAFFFINTKNSEITSLKNLTCSIKCSPLKEIDSKKEIIDEYLKNLEDAKKGNKLINSILFMGIYNDRKDKFKEQKENEIFNYSLEQFTKFRNIEKEDLESFDKEFKNIISKSLIDKGNEITNEINFIFVYYGLMKDTKQINMIKNKFLKLIEKEKEEKQEKINKEQKDIEEQRKKEEEEKKRKEQEEKKEK